MRPAALAAESAPGCLHCSPVDAWSQPHVCRRFFRDRQRINVALSRARHLSIVCGHRSVLALPRAEPWGRVLAGYDGME